MLIFNFQLNFKLVFNSNQIQFIVEALYNRICKYNDFWKYNTNNFIFIFYYLNNGFMTSFSVALSLKTVFKFKNTNILIF